MMPSIIATCDNENARCYINLGIKDNSRIIFDTIVALSVKLKETDKTSQRFFEIKERLEYLVHNSDRERLFYETQQYSAYWSSVGKYKEKSYKLLIDIDDNNYVLCNNLRNEIQKAYSKHG